LYLGRFQVTQTAGCLLDLWHIVDVEHVGNLIWVHKHDPIVRLNLNPAGRQN